MAAPFFLLAGPFPLHSVTTSGADFFKELNEAVFRFCESLSVFFSLLDKDSSSFFLQGNTKWPSYELRLAAERPPFLFPNSLSGPRWLRRGLLEGFSEPSYSCQRCAPGFHFGNRPFRGIFSFLACFPSPIGTKRAWFYLPSRFLLPSPISLPTYDSILYRAWSEPSHLCLFCETRTIFFLRLRSSFIH